MILATTIFLIIGGFQETHAQGGKVRKQHNHCKETYC